MVGTNDSAKRGKRQNAPPASSSNQSESSENPPLPGSFLPDRLLHLLPTSALLEVLYAAQQSDNEAAAAQVGTLLTFRLAGRIECPREQPVMHQPATSAHAGKMRRTKRATSWVD